MKIQLTLLLVVVLLASLPSIVFAQPPVRTLPSGETSEAAPKVETVQKSWKGPFIGIGLGLGWSASLLQTPEADYYYPLYRAPVRFRLGYGLSDSLALYCSVNRIRFLNERVFDTPWAEEYDRVVFGGNWSPSYGMLGAISRRRNDAFGEYQFIGGVGAEFESEFRAYYVMTGYGVEVHPGLSMEVSGTAGIGTSEDSIWRSVRLDLTLNYYLY